MSLLTWILIFSLVGGALSVLAAAGFLLFPEQFRTRLLPHLVSFAVGALLGAAFLDLLPEALEAGVGGPSAHAITTTVLIGILGFFLLEKIVLWRHSHSGALDGAGMAAHHAAPAGGAAHNHSRMRSAGILILIGDGIHNFVDGILIAAAFLTDVRLGVVTSLAIAAHEIPQELGDFAILLHSGMGRVRALVYNMLSTLTTVIGALLAYYSLSGLQNLVPFVLAVAASSFIYIAVADLLPDLHHRARAGKETFQQIVLIGLGILLIYGAQVILHH